MHLDCAKIIFRLHILVATSVTEEIDKSFLSYLQNLKRGIFQEILQGKLDLQSEPWPSISDSAKNLIRKMLDRDPKKRLTAPDLLCKVFH
jgi:serine/threonine protein kinase